MGDERHWSGLSCASWLALLPALPPGADVALAPPRLEDVKRAAGLRRETLHDISGPSVPDEEHRHRLMKAKRIHRKGVFGKALGGMLRELAQRTAHGIEFDWNKPVSFGKTDLNLNKVGVEMEDAAAMLKLANSEVAESKKTLQELANEVVALGKVIEPALMKQIDDIRSSRMAIVSEVRDSLVAMREVRKFFLESDYETEMGRLERFVKVCKEIQALKAAGIFDVICDAAAKLATIEAEHDAQG